MDARKRIKLAQSLILFELQELPEENKINVARRLPLRRKKLSQLGVVLHPMQNDMLKDAPAQEIVHRSMPVGQADAPHDLFLRQPLQKGLPGLRFTFEPFP